MALLATSAGLLVAAPGAFADDDFNAPTPMPFNARVLASSDVLDIQSGEPVTDLAPNGFCSLRPGPDVAIARSFWWSFQGTGGAVRVTTAGSLHTTFPFDVFDTVLTVYRGSPTLAAAIDCSDDEPGTVTSGLVVNTEPGVQYLVQVGACDGSPRAAPAGTLCGAEPNQLGIYNVAAITNDDLTQAVPIATGATAHGTNFGTTLGPGENTGCAGATFDKTVWYGWNAPGAGTGTVTVTGDASMAPVVALYRDGAFVSCALAPAGSGTAQVNVPVSAGGYLIQVGGRGTGTSGQSDFDVSVGFTPPAPNPDRDGDGALNNADCAPDNPAIHPGAVDRPGDHIDQDCSGRDARSRIVPSRARASWIFFRRYTKLTSLAAVNVAAGTRIEVRCFGRSCPFKRPQVKRVTKRRARVSLLGRKLRRARIRPRTTIEVRISRTDFVTRVTRFTFRHVRHDPVQRTLCLAPGARRPRRCA